MIKSTWKKAMCIGLSLLMVAGTLTAAPKKKKGDNPFKNQPKEKKSVCICLLSCSSMEECCSIHSLLVPSYQVYINNFQWGHSRTEN